VNRSSAPTRSEALLLWTGLAAAFSPTILDLARHAIDTPWSRYALVFPVLFAISARRGARPAPRSEGVRWIAAGLAIEIAAAFTGAIRWARPGLALAAFGICQRCGIGSPRAAVLLLFAVPAPAFAVHDGGALLESALSLRAHRGALALAPLLAGLAWYDAVLCRRPLRWAIAASAAAALLAIPILVLMSLLAAGAAGAGWLRSAQWLSGPAPWIPIAAAGIGAAEWRWRRRSGSLE
jgi:hypothetical protein